MVKHSSRVKFCGIYKITSPNGRVYIGQSFDIVERWKVHKRLYQIKNRKNILFKSFIKYGVDNHKFELIKICSKSDLNKSEIFYEKLYDSLNPKKGLNSKGCGSNGEMSEQVRAKISKAHIGIGHSDETKQKLREHSTGKQYCLGRIAPESTRQKLRDINTGKKYSLETRLKVSKALTGRPVSLASREKSSRSNMGKKRSDEARRNISVAHMGIKQSCELIEKRMGDRSRLILNTQTGIYYNGLSAAWKSTEMNFLFFRYHMSKSKKNKTPFIYV